MTDPRIPALTDARAPVDSRPILQQTEKALGMVPNLHRTLAHAPAALRAYSVATKSLASGVLPASMREQIAVATAGLNGCSYCASAHTVLGKGVGIAGDELARNLAAESGDPKVAAALRFVSALVRQRGAVSDAELQAVRDAGFGDAEIVEIVAHVGVNSFTNMFNVLARTTIDFPEVEATRSRPSAA